MTATSGSKVQEARAESVVDSLREETTQNLNENLTEHEVITETVFRGDSVKVERITDRVTVRDRSARTEAKKEEIRMVRDTVYIERTDSTSVKEMVGRSTGPGTARASPVVSALKWIFWIIVSITVLIVVIKMFNLLKL